MPCTDLPSPPAWWKSATVYQIFPHSFFDSNGDGIGDLNGIHAKLDYFKDLGVDVLWLCPIYRSPHADMGYDVSDYFDIDPRYGTMREWRRLASAIHKRGMKILMDFVSNHTSNEHPWFEESKSSKYNPKRDWYIWRPPRYEGGVRRPPNNWQSILQGSAWEFDSRTGEYYLHLFTRQQPDLNWENPDVRSAMAEVMRFWLAQGCDGFRMDAINAISKRDGLPDAKVVDHAKDYQPAQEHWANGPRAHEYLHELYRKVLRGHDVMTVGEVGLTFDPAVIAPYVFPQNEELNEAFNFDMMNLDSRPMMPLVRSRWNVTKFKKIVEKWQTYKPAMGFWNTIFMENHDFGRSVTRFGEDSPEWRAISAKMLAVLQVTQSGTLYVYQGQEIGMKNFPRMWGIHHYKDVATQLHWNLIKEMRQGRTMKDPRMNDILDDLQILARDHARIPMQWDATENVGFTTGTPWMRAYEDDAREGWNVADESEDSESVFSFWKQALHTRKKYDVLIYGTFEVCLQHNLRTFAYVRKLENTTAWVALNLSSIDTEVSVRTTDGFDASLLPQLVLSNYDPASCSPGLASDTIMLRGYEARVYIKEIEAN